MIIVYMDKTKVDVTVVEYRQRGVFMIFDAQTSTLQIRNSSNKTIAVYPPHGYLRAEQVND